MRKISDAERAKIVADYAAGYSGHEIAKSLFHSSQTVYDILHENHVPLKQYRKRDGSKDKRILELYADGKSLAKICLELGKDMKSIKAALLSNGVTPRTVCWRRLDANAVAIYNEYKRGCSALSIAPKYCTSDTSIRRCLEGFGVSFRKKLGVEKTAEIIEKYQNGAGPASLAREYGVCISAISKIITRKGLRKS